MLQRAAAGHKGRWKKLLQGGPTLYNNVVLDR